ncbi:MAG: MFS transporter [Chloroflexota bacterium]
MNTMVLRREKAFYAIMAGQLVSTIGSSMTRFGLGIWVLNETGDTSAFTLLLFFAVLPVGIGSIFAGPLVDRWNRRRTLIVANILASLSTLAIAVLFFADVLELWHLLLAVTVNGLANAFVLPSLEASVPLLVDREQLGRAAGLTQMIQALEVILGPALAGLLIGSAGLGAIFITDFVTFGAVLMALMLVFIPQPSGNGNEMGNEESLWGSFVFGLNYIRERPAFIYLMGFVTLAMFLMPGFGYALVTPLVLSFASEEAAGFVLSTFGFGSLAAGILLAVWGGPKERRMDAMLIALAMSGLAMMTAGFRANLPFVMTGMLFIGVSFVILIGLNRVIWQVKAPPEILGRIFALRVTLGVCAQALGILIAGPLAQNVFEPRMASGGSWAPIIGPVIGTGDGRGIGLIYIVVGAATVLIAIVGFLSPSVRYLEDGVPDYVEPNSNKADLVAAD